LFKNIKGVVDYDFTFLTLVMLLFEHKQSYNAQSSKQREIFYFTEIAF